MKQPLAGWDLATWRISQSDPSKVANIVSVVEVSGLISRELLTSRLTRSLSNFPLLRMAVFDDDGIYLRELIDLKPHEFIQVSNEDVETVVERLARKRVGIGERLWEVVLVHRSAKSYIISSIHHAVADGNSAMLMMNSLFDGNQFLERSPKSSTDQKENDLFEIFKSSAGSIVARLVSDPAGLAQDATSILKSATRLLATNAEGKTKTVSNNFSHQFFRIDKTKLRSVASSYQVSNHDLMTAISVLAFCEYQIQKNLDSKFVTVNVPIAMNLDDAVENKLVVARIEIPTKHESIQSLILGCRDALKKWRNEPALVLASRMVELANFLPLEFITESLNKSDITVSSLAGTSQIIRMAGYEITGVWPVMPPVGAAINFTSLGLNNQTHLGITIDRAAIDDLDVWRSSWAFAIKTVLGFDIFEQIFE